jgi:TPR repeat protein
MAWWRKRTEPQEPDPGAIARADELYRRAAELAHRPGSEADAERISADAVAAYRSLQPADDDPLALPLRREFALALWRHSLLLHQQGRPQAALEPGREGIALARAVLDAAGPSHPEHDELIGETATAMNDLSQAAMAVGRREEHDQLLRDAVALCERQRGFRARQALGTALHNQAVAVANAMVADAARRRPTDEERARLLEELDRVVELRRDLLDSDHPVTFWELASSLRLRGVMRCRLSMAEEGAADLLEGWRTAEPLEGPSADTLRAELRAGMRLAEDAFPAVVEALDWPWPPGEGPAAPDDGAPWWRPAMAEALRQMGRGQNREAIATLTPIAEAGVDGAMHTLALLYDQMGAFRDADEWYRRGADAGNVDAMVVIGCKAAETGQVAEAQRLLSAAAESGQPNALFNYGMLLVQYLQRAPEAMPLWERAAGQGHALAALNLGNLSYQMGRRDDAERWFRRGAELGNAQAMFNLAMVLSVTGHSAEAAQWHRRGLAAEQD